MATQNWLGNAAAVTQVTTLTPASPSVNDTFKVTVNGKLVSYQTAAGTVADVCNGLATALANSVYPEFKEFTPQNTGTTIVVTGATAGVPFTVTLSVTTSGSATFSQSTGTAATGPNDFANAANWSTGSVPISGDDVYFNQGSIPCLYNLAQSSITLNSLNVNQAYTGTIGLPTYNAKGYSEYRAKELQISATTVNIGQGTSGQGSGRIKLNVGSVACTLNVSNTGQPADAGNPALIWRGTSGSNAVNVIKGSVGIAFFPGDTATIPNLRTSFASNQTSDVQLVCGPGCTFTTITMDGGTVTLNSGATTITQNAGKLTILGSGSVGTLTVAGGTCFYNSTGALGGTAVNLYESGTLDFSQDPQAKTVSTTVQRYSDSSILKDPFKVVSSLAIKNNGCSDTSNLTIGINFTLTRS